MICASKFLSIETVFYLHPDYSETDTYNEFNQQANDKDSQIDDEKNNQGVPPVENTITELTCEMK